MTSKSHFTLGILGGGQLGKMIAQAAADLGVRTAIYTPAADAPARYVTNDTVLASYDDSKALAEFAARCDAVTFEFENVPASAAVTVSKHTKLYPSADVLAVAQHRLKEKQCFTENGIPVTQYAAIRSLDDLKRELSRMPGDQAILKTCEQGYDGKGQYVLKKGADLSSLVSVVTRQTMILEAWVPYEYEISVIVARNANGEMKVFPPAKNIHRDGILRQSIVPSGAKQSTLDDAVGHTQKIAEKLNVVGLLTVEWFVLPDGKVLANEMAPRPHNSGHWTLDGCVTSQFEQLVRVITGMPFGSTEILAPTKMINLIGTEIEQLEPYLSNPRAKLHHYGKLEVKQGRKMGHVNILEG